MGTKALAAGKRRSCTSRPCCRGLRVLLLPPPPLIPPRLSGESLTYSADESVSDVDAILDTCEMLKFLPSPLLQDHLQDRRVPRLRAWHRGRLRRSPSTEHASFWCSVQCCVDHRARQQGTVRCPSRPRESCAILFIQS